MYNLIVCVGFYFGFLYSACSAIGDIAVFVTDKTEELAGHVYSINFTSRVVSTLPLFKVIRPVAIDYDDVTGKIFWSDVMTKEIKTSNLNGSDEKTFLHVNTGAIVDGLAIDVDARLLFYTDTGADEIRSVSLNTSETKVIMRSNVEKPRGIITIPDKRIIVWTDWSGFASINYCKYDGTDRHTLVNTEIQWPNGITLEKETETVYWCDAGKKKIESIKLDGTGRKTILQEKDTHYYDIFFYNGALFLTDWNSNAVRQISTNGTEIARVSARGFKKLSGICVRRISRCRDGSYEDGDKCRPCGHCVVGTVCDKVTGKCDRGCQPGYYSNCTGELCVPSGGCNAACDCIEEEKCRRNSSCVAKCDSEWYSSSCLKTTDKSSTVSSTNSPRTSTKISNEDGSEGKPSTSLEASISGTTSTQDFQHSHWPHSEYRSSPEKSNSRAVAGLVCVVVVLALAVGVLSVYLYKYRREIISLKTYDHLTLRRPSSATVITNCSNGHHEYQSVRDEETNALTSRVCPDILVRDPTHQTEKTECDSSLEFIDDEPRYVSVHNMG